MFPKYPERGSAMTSEHAGGTRERILVLLRRHGSLSAPRLAELLQLTSVGVRRHLALLERDGLVDSTTEKPRRGRPTAVYRLTDAGLETFPRHYDEVAREALAFLKGRDAATLAQFLAWRNERLVASYAGRVDGATLAERTDALAEVLNEQGFMAEVEPTEGGLRLCQHNCTVEHLATELPDLWTPEAPERINPIPENVDLGAYKYGWHDPVRSVFTPKKGLSHEVVEEISAMKGEPEWMRTFRHKSLDYFLRRPMPQWGGDLNQIDFDGIFYFLRATEKQAASWEELPADIKNTYDRLGIPEAEKQRLIAGVAAQYESEVVYHKVREDLEEQGVLFLDTDTALKEHEELFREHWATVIPPNDNKFAALNSAVWSGGSFIWIPEGVHVEIPLQAYFRINSQNMGQFERTLIIAEPGSSVHYVEGCTAPIYSSDSLHSAVVEIIVKPHAKVRYTTIQNWSTNVYNLVTKRAAAYEGATMEWIDGNIGSKLTMKYPAVLLLGEHAHGEILSVAFAGNNQHQDAGAKLTFAAPNTTGQIVSKSISRDGGRTSYRGLVKVEEGSPGVKVNVRCDALLLDEESRSDTYPYTDVKEEDVTLGHEATVSKIGDDQLFYLRSRGLSEAEATAMIVRGFIEPISKELPMEYALELNRLISLQMEGAVGQTDDLREHRDPDPEGARPGGRGRLVR